VPNTSLVLFLCSRALVRIMIVIISASRVAARYDAGAAQITVTTLSTGRNSDLRPCKEFLLLELYKATCLFTTDMCMLRASSKRMTLLNMADILVSAHQLKNPGWNTAWWVTSYHMTHTHTHTYIYYIYTHTHTHTHTHIYVCRL
jgi:hypothetical protein